MTVTNALAYYDITIITAVKCLWYMPSCEQSQSLLQVISRFTTLYFLKNNEQQWISSLASMPGTVLTTLNFLCNLQMRPISYRVILH